MIPNMIVPVLNRHDLLQRMLDSIDYPIRKLIIIDNGEPDIKLTIPDWFEEATYTPIPSNLGVAASWNLGIKSFPHDPKWLIVSNDVVWKPGALEEFSEAGPNELVLCAGFPHWQAFSIGEGPIGDVGLFDEMFVSAYFEDTDMARRLIHSGWPIRNIKTNIGHDNSSTLKADATIQKMNSKSFLVNQKYHSRKEQNGDYSAGGWSLQRRRELGWG